MYSQAMQRVLNDFEVNLISEANSPAKGNVKSKRYHPKKRSSAHQKRWYHESILQKSFPTSERSRQAHVKSKPNARFKR